MKKLFLVFTIFILTTVCVSCGNNESSSNELEVTTVFAGQDGNVDAFRNACKEWEEESNCTVVDLSMVVDESFKVRVDTDFETGSEPDVLFYFTGSDSDTFIKENKVVSIEEIREVYPEYVSNINLEYAPCSDVDGKQYAVPIIGYWEGLFVNKAVLEASGVDVPGADYTWNQFLDDCEKIKRAGFVPIAASLGDIPHYWWEYSILNHTGSKDHLTIPNSVEEPIGQAWVQGMEDIKYLYQCGYFPKNTLSSIDEETFLAFIENKSAFLVDGSWRVGGIVRACQSDPDDISTLDLKKLDNFAVTYFPGTEVRPATEILGAFSNGYYITRKAWEDPQKREMAVSFVMHMTSDDVVKQFSQYTTNALLNSAPVEVVGSTSIQTSTIEMLNGKTAIVGAVQDYYSGECRLSTFDGMPEIVTEKTHSIDAVQEGLDIYNQK